MDTISGINGTNLGFSPAHSSANTTPATSPNSSLTTTPSTSPEITPNHNSDFNPYSKIDDRAQGGLPKPNARDKPSWSAKFIYRVKGIPKRATKEDLEALLLDSKYFPVKTAIDKSKDILASAHNCSGDPIIKRLRGILDGTIESDESIENAKIIEKTKTILLDTHCSAGSDMINRLKEITPSNINPSDILSAPCCPAGIAMTKGLRDICHDASSPGSSTVKSMRNIISQYMPQDDSPSAATIKALENIINPKIIDLTVCPSCESSFQTALLQFSAEPPYLEQGIRRDFRKEDWDIKFDRDFYGLTQLYPIRKNKTIRADIIAVTGLDGHAYGSWRAKGGNKSMWLRDFFSKDFPDCRTMIFGYNSKLLDNLGFHTLDSYVNGLHTAIEHARKSEEEKKRPMIFIGHSFGGLVISKALVESQKLAEERSSNFIPHTYATLFFGTPHRGINLDDVETFIPEESERKRLIDGLRQKSNHLNENCQSFIKILQDSKRIKVLSAFEQLQSRKLIDEGGTFVRKGLPYVALDREDACLGCDNLESKVPIEKDHSDIVKLDSKTEPAYTIIHNFLDNYMPPSHGMDDCEDAVCAIKHGNIEVLKRECSNAEEVNKMYDGGETLLHKAASRGSKDMVEFLLENKAEVNAVDGTGCTALHSAVSSTLSPKLSVVKLLLKYRANIAAQNLEGDTALHCAASRGCSEAVEELLKKGAKIEARNKKDQTALHCASSNGWDDVVKVLLQGIPLNIHSRAWIRGASIGSQDEDRQTPLHYAALNGREDVVELLLQEGAKISVVDKDHQTALHCAASKGFENVVEMLLQKASESPSIKLQQGMGRLLSQGKSFINKQDISRRTALHHAAEGGHKKVVDLLTDKADLEIKDGEGRTAIEVAVDSQKMGVVKQLFRKDAKMNPSAMVSALHTAAKGGKAELVESLLKENELDIDARDPEQNTALHLGVSSTDMVRLLLREGANIDARNNRGEVVLHLAVEQGNEDLLDVLLAHGANTNARNQNLDTALHIAIRANNEKLVKLLLCGGANVHARTKKFETTLHLAALESNLNMMADLLDCGAEISDGLPNKAALLYLAAKTGNILVAKSLLNFTTEILQEKGGKSRCTAIEIAMIKRKHEMVEMLKKRGAKPSAAIAARYKIENNVGSNTSFMSNIGGMVRQAS